jgi:hypothetical protein
MFKQKFQSQLVKDLAPAIVALAVIGGAPVTKGDDVQDCLDEAGAVYESCVAYCFANFPGNPGNCLSHCNATRSFTTNEICYMC